MFDVGRIGWIFILRGLFALLFAGVALLDPGMGLMTLLFAFGLYAITDGVYTLGAAFRHADEGERPWSALFVDGFISAAAGGIALFLFHATATGLVFLIASWALLAGAASIASAFYLRKHLDEETLLATGGVLGVLFGAAMMLFQPVDTTVIALSVGGYAFVQAVLLLDLGRKLRAWMKPGQAEFDHRYSPAAEYYNH